nr:deoxyribodipyrimidine photo-lyase [Glycomyces amatae]
MLFTRDLRVHDNPALAAACGAEAVVPLYVDDPARAASPVRRRFLAESLADLRGSLRGLGGDLLVRRGDTVREVVRACADAGAASVHCADDFGRFESGLRERLREACDAAGVVLRTAPGVTALAPGAVLPSTGGDHYKVFTPYWRAWSRAPRRPVEPAPERVRLPEGVTGGDPAAVLGPVPGANPAFPGGEAAAADRLDQWAPRAEDYPELSDDLAADATSRLSPYLSFGCLSPRVLAADPRLPDAFVRQLCWRDFHHQVLAAFPDLARDAYRGDGDWAEDPAALDAWRRGETGIAIVDAGMRQLLAEAWMPGRARLVCAAYLTKTLGLDWRHGAAWFAERLVDLDEANNAGNWQWTAGTGNDTKPYRRFSHERQAARFDPDGAYRRRWAP